MKDPIIEELWKAKDQIAKDCNNDLDTLAAKLKESEKQRDVVNPSKSGNVKK